MNLKRNPNELTPPLPSACLSLSSTYNVFCIYCTTKPSPCAVTVRRCSCFCFRFCCCSQRAMHTHNPCSSSSSRRTRVWVSESALLCMCVFVSVCCLSTGNPYAAMLGVSLLLWLHSPSSERQYSSQTKERQRESERASERREVFVRERKHFQFSWRRRLPSSAASLSHALLDAARFRFLRFRNAHATSTASALHHLSISLTNTKATKTYDRLWEG